MGYQLVLEISNVIKKHLDNVLSECTDDCVEGGMVHIFGTLNAEGNGMEGGVMFFKEIYSVDQIKAGEGPVDYFGDNNKRLEQLAQLTEKLLLGRRSDEVWALAVLVECILNTTPEKSAWNLFLFPQFRKAWKGEKSALAPPYNYIKFSLGYED